MTRFGPQNVMKRNYIFQFVCNPRGSKVLWFNVLGVGRGALRRGDGGGGQVQLLGSQRRAGTNRDSLQRQDRNTYREYYVIQGISLI